MNKPVWIWSCGTYRTASTTHYMMTRDIVQMTGNGKGIGYHQESKLKDYDVPRREKFIVCKVFEYIPAGFQGRKEKVGRSVGQTIYREHRMKAFATIRDPRDIITSMRERHRRQMEDPAHQRKPFDFQHRVEIDFPLWLGQLDRWINLGPTICMVSRYEVFTADLLTEVKRIADHLDINLPHEKAREIAAKHTLEAIVAHKKSQRAKGIREDPFLPSIPGPLFGMTGAYKDHLTRAEEQEVIKHNRKWMEKYGYL